MALPEKHVVSLNHQTSNADRWQANCSCGWQADCNDKPNAVGEGQAHLGRRGLSTPLIDPESVLKVNMPKPILVTKK